MARQARQRGERTWMDSSYGRVSRGNRTRNACTPAAGRPPVPIRVPRPGRIPPDRPMTVGTRATGTLAAGNLGAMCGRFVSASPPERIAAYFGADVDVEALGPNYNVAPTNDIYAVVATPSDDDPGTTHRALQ